MLVSMLEILEKAKEGGYGVLAPNVFNEDSVRVCIEAAVELDSPLIIDVLPDNHKDIVSFGKLICSMAHEVRIPIALNLDHGEMCIRDRYVCHRYEGGYGPAGIYQKGRGADYS